MATTDSSQTTNDAAVDPARIRRRNRFLAVAAAGLVALTGLVLKVGVEPIVAAGHGLVRLATEKPQVPEHHLAPAEAPAPPVHDALAGMPADARAALTRPEVEAGLSFRFQPVLGPAEICRHLDGAGLKNKGWAPILKGPAHECMSDLVTVPGSKPVARTIEQDPEAGGAVTLPPAPSTLFFTARGRSEHAIDTIRFKLNLEDASVDRTGREMLIKVLGDLARTIAWPIPDPVAEAIRRQKKAVEEVGGIRVEVLPENGDIRRINVVLLLGTPATRLPPDRFVPAPPIPKEMLKEDPAEAARRLRKPGVAAIPPEGAVPATDAAPDTADASVTRTAADGPIDQVAGEAPTEGAGGASAAAPEPKLAPAVAPKPADRPYPVGP